MKPELFVAFGHDNVKVDAKGRMFVPSKFNINQTEELICFPRDEHYILVLLSWLRERLNELTELKRTCNNRELARDIEKQMRTVYHLVIGQPMSLDAQRRIVLPQTVREKCEERVQLVGQGNKIAVFPTAEIYEEYVKKLSLETPTILR
ncbi:MAG: hypothetical protein IJO63_04360 [Bacilli bacterium]|nr:hypothetical protein [Bacilli bacterium]